VRKHLLELIAATAALSFLISGRVPLRDAARAIDADLLLLLLALLLTVELLRASGYLEFIVRGAVSHFATTRTFSLALVAVSGMMACVLTNDVALFVVIPFTVIARRFSAFDLENVVILEIVATNLIGCLTPLGNPQNLFLFSRSGWSAGQFMLAMLPFVGWCAIAILAATLASVQPRPIQMEQLPLARRQRLTGFAGAVCLALIALDVMRLVDRRVAAAVAVIAALALLRGRLLRVDLSIVPLFFFAFIIVEGLRTFGLRPAADVYASSIVLSQLISNVPAAILLTPFAGGDWLTLLYGVNAGGCGTIIASLANLLGWRLYMREVHPSDRDPRFFRRLTMFNFAFLGWAALGGWVLLRAG
jgi:Na+/H+ antiporter NhaD/arsenite permease-like protein